jgi:uncharacterized phage-associated protein
VDNLGKNLWKRGNEMLGNVLASDVIARLPNLPSMKLQKLLYYVDSWHLAIKGDRLITDQPFRAYVDGPVHEDSWHKRKAWGTREYAEGSGLLSSEAEAILDLVIAEYGSRSGDELSALTHTELPWSRARNGLEPNEPSRVPLSEALIADFYRQNRMLGGRTAADLAAGGIFASYSPKVDVALPGLSELLSALPPAAHGDYGDEFGANLFDSTGLDLVRARDTRG